MCNVYAALGMQAMGALSSAGAASGAAASTKADLAFKSKIASINSQSIMDAAEINKKTTEEAAQTSMLAGEQDAHKIQLGASQLKSHQKVSLAANGIDLSSDTAQQILNTTDVMSEADVNTVQTNAVRQAWGYRMQGEAAMGRARTEAANESAQAGRSAAASSAIDPNMSYKTSLLGSAGQVAGSWYQYSKAK